MYFFYLFLLIDYKNKSKQYKKHKQIMNNVENSFRKNDVNMEEIYGEHMFDKFKSVDCEDYTQMHGNYFQMQEDQLNYPTNATHTYMRCFRKTDCETQMWTDQFKTRFYDNDAECRDAHKKLKEKQPEIGSNPVSDAPNNRIMRVDTRLKEAYYPCPENLWGAACYSCANGQHKKSDIMNIRNNGDKDRYSSCNGYTITPINIEKQNSCKNQSPNEKPYTYNDYMTKQYN
jgi:hypothetical protein